VELYGIPSIARQQAVLDYVADPAHVSNAQRDAVVHEGNFFLNACPGSGKTRTVGVRIARWAGVVDPELGRPRRVAATSYTNTAVREILNAADQAGFPVSGPHFVGTLHRWLSRYVVRPLGSRVLGCEGAPRIVAMPSRQMLGLGAIEYKHRFTETTIPAWAYEWRVDGTVTLPEAMIPYALHGKLDAAQIAHDTQAAAIKGKQLLARRGLLSMGDLLYWALQVLEDPSAATVIASRFDELVVDEAQDTTVVQQACIRRLVDAGLSSIVYVGDIEQAIYGFAFADVPALQALIGDTTEAELRLTENWRSSQAICDVTYRFSVRTEADHAVGEYAGFGVTPEILTYEAGAEAQVVDRFRDRLTNLEIDHREAVVLCRWTATAERLQGDPDVALTGGIGLLAGAAREAAGGSAMSRDVIRDVEALVYAFVDSEGDLDDVDADLRLRLRVACVELIDRLPSFDHDAKSWAEGARVVLSDVIASFSGEKASVGNRVRAPKGAGERIMNELLAGASEVPLVRTIHSAKGESHAATLLVGVDSDRGDSNWNAWLGAGDPEEVRVAYVALTRAQRYSALALPSSCPPEVFEAFEQRGFVRI